MKYILLLSASILLFSCNSNKALEATIQVLNDSIALLEGKIMNERVAIKNVYQTKIDSLMKKQQDEDSFWFDQIDKEYIIEQGITNPETDLYDALISQHDFQQDAILGGQMMIDKIKLIGKEWLLAWGCDGHVIIRYIFRYEIRKDKTIKWTLIDKEK